MIFKYKTSKTSLRFLASCVAFLFYVLLSNPSLAQIAPAGMDQVLSSFAAVVKARANAVALDIIRGQLVSALDGKTIVLPSKGQQPATLYLGGPVTDTNHYFQSSFQLISPENENLSLTDPVLLKTISQDFVDFSFRIIVGVTDEKDAQYLDMRGISNFIYQSIRIMSTPGSDVHTLSDLMLKLSIDISSGFSNAFLTKVNSDAKTPITLTDQQVTQAIDEVVLNVLKNKAMPDLKSFSGNYGFNPNLVFSRYKAANTNANKELASFFGLIGSILYTDQIDSNATSTWLQNFSNDMVSVLNAGPQSNPVDFFEAVRLKVDQDESLNDSSLVSQTLKSSFDTVFDTIICRYFTTPKSQFNSAALTELVPDLVKIITTAKSLAVLKSPSPEMVGTKLATLMNDFADLIDETNKIPQSGENTVPDSGAPEVLKTTSLVLQYVAGHNWLDLVQLAYQKSLVMDKDNKSGVQNILAFVRILMQMYQATSVADAQQILSANLESISSREKRYNNDLTLDVTCLLGVREGYEDPQNPYPKGNGVDGDTNLVGLYAPLGLQIAHNFFGLLLYPVDLGTYITTSSENSNNRVSDAIRLGFSFYGRINAFPVDIGFGGDAKPSMDGANPIYRGFGFVSLELPLFMLK